MRECVAAVSVIARSAFCYHANQYSITHGVTQVRKLIKTSVSSAFANTNRCNSLASCFQSHDREKRRTYEQRVREIEWASFTPLVFSALGRMNKPAETTYKRLASLLATKKNQQYNVMITADYLFPYYVRLSFFFVEVVLLLVGLIKISLTFLLL